MIHFIRNQGIYLLWLWGSIIKWVFDYKDFAFLKMKI